MASKSYCWNMDAWAQGSRTARTLSPSMTPAGKKAWEQRWHFYWWTRCFAAGPANQLQGAPPTASRLDAISVSCGMLVANVASRSTEFHMLTESATPRTALLQGEGGGTQGGQAAVCRQVAAQFALQPAASSHNAQQCAVLQSTGGWGSCGVIWPCKERLLYNFRPPYNIPITYAAPRLTR